MSVLSSPKIVGLLIFSSWRLPQISANIEILPHEQARR